MTLRTRIAGLVIAALVGTLALLAVAVSALGFADQVVSRVDAVQRRFEVMADLSAQTSAYGKRVADVLLIGRGQMPLVQAARIDIERTYALLTRVTRAELATLSGMSEVQGQLPQLEDVRRMIELYHAIDASAAKALAQARDGDAAGAVSVYQRDVAFRLDNELRPLIDAGLGSERREVGAQLDRLQQARTWLLPVALAVALIALATLLWLGRGLRRAVTQPVAQTTATLDALASGAPAPQPGPPPTGEFAPLDTAIGSLAARIAAERTEAIAHRTELERARLRLADLDSAHGEFLAEIGHELRTPLTVLRGEADVALRGAADPQALRETMERIRTQSAELALLLDDMLAMVRQDPAGQPFEQHPVVMQEVAAAALAEARLLAAPREVTLSLDAGRDPVTVTGDFRRLKQALLIGLDNAIKHSPPGATITISVAMEGPDSVQMAVLDNGPGVDANDIPRAFDRFYRGKGEREMFNQGLGIGLAIARDIVGRHGGSITLGNRPEGGAVLAITLPRRGIAP